MKKSLKYFTVIVTLGVLWMLIGYVSAYYATMPSRKPISMPVSLSSYPYQDLSITTADGLAISAWLIGKSDTTVILLSGIKANRLANIDRALLYLEKGYSVLLPDLRATGKSEGEVVSFGWHEQKDLIACYVYLQTMGKQKIGLHGSSLGAATITYALKQLPHPYFMILESPYDQLNHAIEHRMAPFMLPRWVYSPMLWMGEWRTNIVIDQLQPKLAIQDCHAPLLHLAGDAEKVLPVAETQAIFDNCPSPSKELYFFKGARHQDLLKGFTIEYIQVWEAFMNQL